MPRLSTASVLVLGAATLAASSPLQRRADDVDYVGQLFPGSCMDVCQPYIDIVQSCSDQGNPESCFCTSDYQGLLINCEACVVNVQGYDPAVASGMYSIYRVWESTCSSTTTATGYTDIVAGGTTYLDVPVAALTESNPPFPTFYYATGSGTATGATQRQAGGQWPSGFQSAASAQLATATTTTGDSSSTSLSTASSSAPSSSVTSSPSQPASQTVAQDAASPSSTAPSSSAGRLLLGGATAATDALLSAAFLL
ncbi:hypothetical protein JCM8097_002748 [Rhodosporidiobolus ruineniae]